jgi:branched-subunit amino acid aminotransferase/4-amino-4-deoxychorismate lyase
MFTANQHRLTAKNFNRMDLTKGTFEALDHGADAAVLLSIEGYVAEGPGFNIWVVRSKTLLTLARQFARGNHPPHHRKWRSKPGPQI